MLDWFKFLRDHWKWVIAIIVALPGALWALVSLIEYGGESGHPPTQIASGSGNNTFQLGDGARVEGDVNVNVEQPINDNQEIIKRIERLEQIFEQSDSKTHGEREASEEDHYRKALKLYKELGGEEGMRAFIFGTKGLLLLGGTRFGQGSTHFGEPYSKDPKPDKELSSKEVMAITYANLGTVYKTRGELEKACAHWGKALALYREIGIKHNAEAVQSWMKEAGCPENAKQ